MTERRRISCACFTCCGSISGTLGWRDLRRQLMNAGSLAEAEGSAAQVLRETDEAAVYWCEKALVKGLRHLATG